MKKCFIALFALIISLFILLLSTSIVVSNFYFYKQQLKKYDVYKDFNLKSIVDKKTKEIIYYIKDDINSLDSSFFSRRAIRHMKDVKKLYHHLLLFFYGSSILILLFLFFCFIKKKIKLLALALLTSGFINIISFFIIAISITFYWHKLFVFFHKIFFKNRSWIFYPNSTITKLFPSDFFIGMSYYIGIIATIITIMEIILGIYILKKIKKTK